MKIAPCEIWEASGPEMWSTLGCEPRDETLSPDSKVS